MSSSPDYIGTISDSEENIYVVTDTVISCLNSCKYEYEEKEKENFVILDKLGFNINDLSEDIKQDLKNLFSDNEVLNVEHSGRMERVTINAQHMQESLTTEDKLVDVELLVREADAFLKKAEEMHCLLERQLDTAKAHSKYINDISNEKVVKEMIVKGQLEKKEHELNSLQKITEEMERPKFAYEEVETLQGEEKKLREEVTILEAKLAKYHSLPLDEKAAAQLLVKLKEELVGVDNDIKMKLTDY